MSALKSVENLTLKNDDDGNPILTWTNPNGKDDFASYKIDLYYLDENGEEKSAGSVTPCENEENKVSVPVLQII